MRCSAALPLCVASCLVLSSCAPLWPARQQTLKVSLPGQIDPQAAAAAEELLQEAEHDLDHDRPEKARQRLEEALRLNPTLGPAYNNLGLIYFGRRQLYEAACAFNETIPLMPDSGIPHNNLGLTLEAGGRIPDAIMQFEQAYALDSRNAEFLGNLVRARIASGEVSDTTIALLQELLFLESRPEWVTWAEEELAIHIPKALSAVTQVNGQLPAGGTGVNSHPPATPTLPLAPPAPDGDVPLVLPPLPDAALETSVPDADPRSSAADTSL